MKIERNVNDWSYKVNGYSDDICFEECSLGKYKGKTFMYDRNTHKCWSVNVLNKKHIWRNVYEIEEIEILGEVEYTEVFFSTARETFFGIIDISDDIFKGYTYNCYWNGWDMPMFEKEVVFKIIESFECDNITYSEADDSFTIISEDDDEPSIEKGHDIKDENGNIHHVYDIGAGSWIWSEREKKGEDEDE